MKVIDLYNSIVGGVIAVLAAIFGDMWFLFAALAILNIIDWLTGWYKAYRNHEESSYKGLKGIIKKLGYWAIILVAWIVSYCFIYIGGVLHINLDFMTVIGWFTLAMLLVNEARSILENLVELGVYVPEILIKGLAVTEKLINAKSPIDDDEESEDKQDEDRS